MKIAAEVRPTEPEKVIRWLTFADLVDYLDITDTGDINKSFSMADLIADKYGIEKIIFNLACRDRDEADLKRYAEGVYRRCIRNILILQGDHKDHRISMVKPTDLMKYVSQYMNVGAVANPNADMKSELELAKRKIAAGARYFLTQPVFDLRRAQEFSESLPDIEMYHGLLVLPRRYEDAVVIPQKYPGVPEIPERDLHMLRNGATNIDIARERLITFKENRMNSYISSASSRDLDKVLRI